MNFRLGKLAYMGYRTSLGPYPADFIESSWALLSHEEREAWHAAADAACGDRAALLAARCKCQAAQL